MKAKTDHVETAMIAALIVIFLLQAAMLVWSWIA